MGPGQMAALGMLMFGLATGSGQKPKTDLKPQQGTLKVGMVAPKFELADADGKNPVRLADLVGKPVVLVFGSCT